MKEYRNFVDGAFVGGARTFPDVNPVDGSEIALVHEADAAVVDAAVGAARALRGHEADANLGRTL